MALSAQYEIVPGVKVPVYVRLSRTFCGKTEGIGGVVQTFGGSVAPEPGAKPLLPDYNSQHAAWSATDKAEVSAYTALKAMLLMDARYSVVVDC